MIRKSTGSLPAMAGSSGENEAACPVVMASFRRRSFKPEGVRVVANAHVGE